MAGSTDTPVKVSGLSKEFLDFWRRPKAKAVNDIDFEVKEGEVFGLLGPNGSGKSTTLKMILGLLYPTAGTVTVFGKSPQNVMTKSRIGYLPEESYLYKYLTAYETLDFFGAIFGLSAADRKKGGARKAGCRSKVRQGCVGRILGRRSPPCGACRRHRGAIYQAPDDVAQSRVLGR